jgi:hypothetical protein
MSRPELLALLPAYQSWLRRPLPPPPEEPVVEGDGALICSSCVALERHPTVVWDVNGYYRALGVDPRATRSALRRAYQDADGQRSAYLTYVLKQLLQPAVRRAYDATPLGRPFVDEYLVDALKKAAHEESGRRRTAGLEDSAEEVMDEWGVSLDEPHPEEFNQGPPESQWDYAYYVWGTWSADATDLPAWQRMVVASLAGRGVVARFAVGVRGDYQGSLVADEGGVLVVYLGELSESDQKTADSAARRITELITHRR